MKARLITFALITTVVGCATPVTNADFESWTTTKSCQQLGKGRVVYMGDTGPSLDACLDAAGQNIRELRITSAGGDATKTLRIVERYAGRIDLVIVDHLCASACANYVIPAARRLLVQPNSFVMIHGSIPPSFPQEEIDRQVADIHQQHPEVPIEQLKQGMDKAMKDLAEQAKAQDEFELQRLKCPEWLHPENYKDRALKNIFAGDVSKIETVKFLLVSKTMAARCLKHTRIERFWSPPAQEQLPEMLKSQGALLAP